MRIAIALVACAALLASAGCKGSDDSGSPGEESSLVGESTDAGSTDSGSSDSGSSDSGSSDDNGDAGTPDSPVSGGEQGSASLPSLPIGGDVAFEAADTPVCAFLAWNGTALPAGVAVHVEHLDKPDGVSEDSSESCDGPPCLDADSFTADQASCSVGFVWDGTSPSGDLSISAKGSVSCESQSDCEDVKTAASEGGGVATVELPESTDSESSDDSSDSESSEPSDSSEPSESSEPTDPTESETS